MGSENGIQRSCSRNWCVWFEQGDRQRDWGREFEPSAAAIRNWVKQADLDEGTRTDGLKTDEREELVRLRQENARLKEEQEILSKAAAWFAQETDKKSRQSSSS